MIEKPAYRNGASLGPNPFATRMMLDMGMVAVKLLLEQAGGDDAKEQFVRHYMTFIRASNDRVSAEADDRLMAASPLEYLFFPGFTLVEMSPTHDTMLDGTEAIMRKYLDIAHGKDFDEKSSCGT